MATIDGTSGSDNLIGGGADDVINGFGGIDTIAAGSGDDRIVISDHPTSGNQLYSNIDGGTGHDILDLSGWHGPLDMVAYATGEILAGENSSPANGYTYTALADVRGVEEIWLPQDGHFSASLMGVTASDPFPVGWKVVGSSGADGVGDGRGNDTIVTGAGNDGVTFQGGDDQVSLGDGDDRYLVENLIFFSGNATVDAGSGTDELFWDNLSTRNTATIDLEAGQATDGTSHISLTGFENVWVTGPLQNPLYWQLEVSGNAGANQIHASIGHAVLNGRGGDDAITLEEASSSASATVYGGSGNDQVLGGDGAEWLNGGQAPDDPYDPAGFDGGNDTLEGFGGNDHIYGNAQTAVAGSADGNDQIECDAGSDYANGNAGADRIIGGGGSDRLYGGAGNDLIYGDLSDGVHYANIHGNDHLNGNKGNDTLYGGDGDDDLRGGQDDDELHGDDGADMLGGDSGDDMLIGGGGRDWLSGGLGRDMFKFDAGEAEFGNLGAGEVETIADFTAGDDRIWLGFHPTVLRDAGPAADPLAAKAAADTLAGASAGHTIVLTEVGHDTYMMFAETGSGALDSAIRLENVAASDVSIADFV